MSEGGQGAGRATDFVGSGGGRSGARRGKIGRTLRAGSPPTQEVEAGGSTALPPALPGRTAAGEKPVRITVDLDPERHRRLKLYTLDAGARGAAVIRALLDELDEDAELSERVRRRVSEKV